MASGINSYNNKEWDKNPHQMETLKPRPAVPLEVIMDRVLSQLSTRGIGFNNHEVFFRELSNMGSPKSTYPPFDILSTGEDSYEIRLALAGFGREDIELTFKDQILSVSGAKKEEDTDAYFHKGIGGRDFKQTFPLAEYIEVKDAAMKDGILTISLDRNVPEELKPKTIKIK